MSGMFSGRGGLGGLASPLKSSIDPVGNKTSDALFGAQKKKGQQAAAIASSTGQTDDTAYGSLLEGDGTAANKNEKLKVTSTSTSGMLGS